MWLFTWREGGDGDADGKCLSADGGILIRGCRVTSKMGRHCLITL